ncbi:hypothetical protein HPB49_013917 [Dermacentor silvarum]|uniref:Uncharacterized protein n=1 Tax=Dermacentor silvarum TaxID=543639 RepID=A0ACB8C3Y9_DERSI|nr:hypothetical protein HPB49_013917 [Dermacentor silvarum]
MVSVMAAHFKPYGWICRAAGLFFLQGLQSRHVQDVRVTWRTWYTLYSLACLLCFTAVELAIAVANEIRIFFRVRSFTKSLILVIFAVMAVKVAINVATAIFGTRGMVEFFKKSAEYEMRTGFKREHHRYKSRISYVLRFFFVVAFFAHIVVNANMTMRMVDVAGSQFLEFALKAGILVFNSLFFVYDVLHFVVLRPCCEVIVSYIRHQHDTLKTTLETGHGFAIAKHTGSDDCLEAVRINLCSIGNLRRMINATWQFSIMVSATVILTITCIFMYCIFDEGVPMDQLMLTMTYCLYSAADFVDVAQLSQMMSNEAVAGAFMGTPTVLAHVRVVKDGNPVPRGRAGLAVLNLTNSSRIAPLASVVTNCAPNCSETYQLLHFAAAHESWRGQAEEEGGEVTSNITERSAV